MEEMEKFIPTKVDHPPSLDGNEVTHFEDLKLMLFMILESYGLIDEMRNPTRGTDPVEIKFVMDGFLLTRHRSYIACGIEVIDKRADYEGNGTVSVVSNKNGLTNLYSYCSF